MPCGGGGDDGGAEARPPPPPCGGAPSDGRPGGTGDARIGGAAELAPPRSSARCRAPLALRTLRACERYVMTTNDQESGRPRRDKHGGALEPLATLKVHFSRLHLRSHGLRTR